LYGFSVNFFMPHETWGTVSNPVQAINDLGLESRLASVPENGIAVDVGAGAGLSLAAAIYVARPDIRVVSVDTGFDIDWFPEYLDETVGSFSPNEESLLRASSDWQQCVVGFAEELPVRTESADLVVSYAAVPLYTEYDASLQECHRILKLGGTAILGPLPVFLKQPWEKIVDAAADSGMFSAKNYLNRTVDTWQGPIKATVTHLIK
jgi:SAM-dependent methyltransferase